MQVGNSEFNNINLWQMNIVPIWSKALHIDKMTPLKCSLPIKKIRQKAKSWNQSGNMRNFFHMKILDFTSPLIHIWIYYIWVWKFSRINLHHEFTWKILSFFRLKPSWRMPPPHRYTFLSYNDFVHFSHLYWQRRMKFFFSYIVLITYMCVCVSWRYVWRLIPSLSIPLYLAILSA